MKIIGVVVGKHKDSDYMHTKLVIEKLLKKDFEVMVSPEVSSVTELPVI